MLKFLRTIRKTLIVQENTRKYLLYAFGELFLIILGVLIAVQMSNWNDSRILKQSANNNLTLLVLNLQEDKEQMEELKQRIEDDEKKAEVLLNIYKGLQPSSENIPEKVIRLILEYSFVPRKTAIDIIVSSGELGALDIETQRAISKYYLAVDAIQDRDRISKSFIQDKYERHVFDNYGYFIGKGNTHPDLIEFYSNDTRKPFQLDTVQFRNDKKMETLVFARYFQISSQKEAYEKALDELNDLLTLINN